MRAQAISFAHNHGRQLRAFRVGSRCRYVGTQSPPIAAVSPKRFHFDRANRSGGGRSEWQSARGREWTISTPKLMNTAAAKPDWIRKLLTDRYRFGGIWSGSVTRFRVCPGGGVRWAAPKWFLVAGSSHSCRAVGVTRPVGPGCGRAVAPRRPIPCSVPGPDVLMWAASATTAMRSCSFGEPCSGCARGPRSYR